MPSTSHPDQAIPKTQVEFYRDLPAMGEQLRVYYVANLKQSYIWMNGRYEAFHRDEKTLKAIDLAEAFHQTYEELAPYFGYETRLETRQFDQHSKNGQLMIAVCRQLIDQQATASWNERVAAVFNVPEGQQFLALRVPTSRGSNESERMGGVVGPNAEGRCAC